MSWCCQQERVRNRVTLYRARHAQHESLECAVAAQAFAQRDYKQQIVRGGGESELCAHERVCAHVRKAANHCCPRRCWMG